MKQAYRTFIRVLAFVVVMLGGSFTAEPVFAGDVGSGVRLGVEVLRLDHLPGSPNKPFWKGSIPSVSVEIPIGGRYVQLTFDWKIMWGLSKFTVDSRFPGIGARIYPVAEYVSIFGTAGWGTFLLDNSSLWAETGVDFDIPFARSYEKKQYVSIGAAYHYEYVRPLIGFIEEDRHPEWYPNSTAWMFRLYYCERTIPPEE